MKTLKFITVIIQYYQHGQARVCFRHVLSGSSPDVENIPPQQKAVTTLSSTLRQDMDTNPRNESLKTNKMLLVHNLTTPNIKQYVDSEVDDEIGRRNQDEIEKLQGLIFV